MRNQSKEYKKNKSKYDTKPVEISLLSANRKISNMIFSLNFYQTDAVGGNREAATRGEPRRKTTPPRSAANGRTGGELRRQKTAAGQ